MIKNIFFDLDGTLLLCDQDQFTKEYISLLTNKFVKLGYSKELFIKGLISGTYAMVNNDGKFLNSEVFWRTFSSICGNQCFSQMDEFDKYYKEEYQTLKSITTPIQRVGENIRKLKFKGFNLILATNPLFPVEAQISRLNWAGVDPSYFSYITCYDNSHYSKPNSLYYKELLSSQNMKANETIMVGNDMVEDLSCYEEGIDIFIVTPCLINRNNLDINKYKHGLIDDFFDYVSLF